MSMNRVCIMGRLTRAPELRRTQSGTAVTSFTLAVDDDFKDKLSGERKTYFIDVVAWRQTAEFVNQYFAKGRMAIVDGRLQSRKWDDKDGNKHKTVEVIADSVYFGDSKPQEGPAAYSLASSSPGEFSEVEDDGDLPF
uniref:Single-stranded DNA-binding protein n=1 Tax=Podoviridae sp. ctyDR6 TaxID=2825288 RepID=A0A8S5QK26_9CAUD|nr:MAG TPA: Single strand binding protein [Podoviridae sp. ctyDR6]